MAKEKNMPKNAPEPVALEKLSAVRFLALIKELEQQDLSVIQKLSAHRQSRNQRPSDETAQKVSNDPRR